MSLNSASISSTFFFWGGGQGVGGGEQETVRKGQMTNNVNFHKLAFSTVINIYRVFKHSQQSNFLTGQALSSLKQHVDPMWILHHGRTYDLFH